jgi:hypothetical protein
VARVKWGGAGDSSEDGDEEKDNNNDEEEESNCDSDKFGNESDQAESSLFRSKW